MTEHTHPFRHWVIEDWCKPVSYACLPEWDDPTWEARYDNDLESGKRTTRNVFGHFANVIDRMRSDVEWWRRITGIMDLEDDPEMWGGGRERMSNGVERFIRCMGRVVSPSIQIRGLSCLSKSSLHRGKRFHPYD
jgi:hypothetical protein